MSKVRINDLAREMEVKSRQVLDILAELGLATGKTHSSSLEDYEAEKVRTHFDRGSSRSGGQTAASRGPQGIAPKIDLSHISKPGDVMKAILANKEREEQQARHSHAPARPVVAVQEATKSAAPVVVAAAPPAAVSAARPEPRKIFPQPRVAPPIIVRPPAQPAIASRPPANPVVAKAPVGAVPAHRPTVAVAPPAVPVVVKPPVEAPVVEAPAIKPTPVPVEAAPTAPEVTVPVVEPVIAPPPPPVVATVE